MEQPNKDDVKRARLDAGLKPEEAADLVHLGSKSRWYEYENGTRNIEVSRWELFLVKSGLHPEYTRRRPRSRK